MTEQATPPRRHMFYNNPKTVSIENMRIEANFYAEKGGWDGTIRGTTIHYHKHDEACTNQKHEEFEPQVPQEK